MRSLLDFLGEPYTAKCLEPLAQRINSSNVPDDFKSEDPGNRSSDSRRGNEIEPRLEGTAQPAEASAAAAAEMEAAFARTCPIHGDS